MIAKLVVVEKPSQVKTVKSIFRDATVLPCRGHLLRLQEPQEANKEWKTWTSDVLLPKNILYDWKVDGDPDKRKKYQAIKTACKALPKSQKIYLATDPDREGTLIGASVLKLAGIDFERVLRVAILSETKEAVQEAFDKATPLLDDRNFNQYQEALARINIDQICNLSLTRAATVKVGAELKQKLAGPISIGRVMTPTLSIVCKRQLENENHVEQTYFDFEATTDINDLILHHVPNPRLTSELDVSKIIQENTNLSGPSSVIKKRKTEVPPQLFDLTNLYNAMGKKPYAWKTDHCLEVLQKLYEKGLVTYPRSEYRYLPSDNKAKTTEIWSQAVLLVENGADLPKQPELYDKRIYNDDKLKAASHYAIIPTKQGVNHNIANLSEDEKALLLRIVKRFVKAHLPIHEYQHTEIKLINPTTKALWSVTGRISQVAGWRTLHPAEDAILPEVTDGQNVTLTEIKGILKKTKPPPLFNEARLIAAMSNADKYTVYKDFGKVLREKEGTTGIGTPATRVAIIKNLITRNQIFVKNNSIYATNNGMAIYKLLKQTTNLEEIKAQDVFSLEKGTFVATPKLAMFTDPVTTAMMEVALKQILEGKHKAKDTIIAFADIVKNFISEINTIAISSGSFATSAPSSKKSSFKKFRKFKAKRKAS